MVRVVDSDQSDDVSSSGDMWAVRGMVKKMTYNQKRIIGALLLVFVVFAGANYYFGFGILPRFAKLIMMFSVLLTLVYVGRFGPTRQEIDEYRKKKREKQQ